MSKERRTTRKRLYIPLALGLLCLLFLCMVSLNVSRVQAISQVWCVDDSGGATDTIICANPTAFTTIGAAVNAAVAGDEIRVATGSYGTTTFDKPLTIGEGYTGGALG